jgi:hypothetical protein
MGRAQDQAGDAVLRPIPQMGAEAGGDRDPALGVEAILVRAEELAH